MKQVIEKEPQKHYMEQKNREMVDILKAIGIVGIIIGHADVALPFCNIPLAPFVYLYHLMIFFFTAGFCFNEEKYKNHIELYFGRRIKSLMPRYFAYNLVFTLLHNTLLRMGILPAGTDYYTFDRILESCISGALLTTEEKMLGPFWFISILLIASVFFGLVFTFSQRFKHSDAVLIIFGLFFAVLGLYINHRGMWLSYHMQTSLIAVPVMILGWFARKHFYKIERFFDWKMCIISAILMITFIRCGGAVELSENRTGFYAFYPITVIGISFCISLARLLMRLPDLLRKGVSFIGRNSFDYMALHLVFFKIIDYVYARIKNDPVEVISKYPHSYQLNFIYPIVSIAVISLLLLLCKRARKEIKACR